MVERILYRRNPRIARRFLRWECSSLGVLTKVASLAVLLQ
jgi:hypothetical protein